MATRFPKRFRNKSICMLRLLAFGFLGLLTWHNSASAANCELSTRSDADSDESYKNRGDRCEGVYRQNVSGRVNLRVVGYHANRVEIDDQDDEWEIRLHTQLGERLERPSIRVVSLRATDYFQMDTDQISDNGEFIWKTDVLAKLTYPPRPRHLAAIACLPNCSEKRSDSNLLFPVSFGPNSSSETDGSSIVFVMADVELKSLNATLVPIGSTTPIYEDKPVGGQFLPAKRAQRILVTDLQNRRATLKLVGETHSGRRAYYEVDLWPNAID